MAAQRHVQLSAMATSIGALAEICVVESHFVAVGNHAGEVKRGQQIGGFIRGGLAVREVGKRGEEAT